MRFRPHDVTREARADGTLVLRARDPLGPVATRVNDWLDHWAEHTPDAVFLAERSGAGWREVRYREAQERVEALARGLLSLDLTPKTPILVLSGNSVDHGLLALAAQAIGVPIVPLAEQYSLIPEARGRVDHAANLINPGLVYAEDGAAFADVLGREVFQHCIKLVSRSGELTLDLIARAGGDSTACRELVGPDTVAKILLTSGSTGAPKGVPQTQRMMCVNQAQLAQALPFLTQKPPRIVDWLPWNHVFGGSHNFNMMLANGGALYIDHGKPVQPLATKTLENLALKTGTIIFNVPAGYALIRDALKGDLGLRRAFFEDLDMLFYAGSSLPADIWADLEAMAREICDEMPLFTTSWGLTETAPAHLLQHQHTDGPGMIGVPLPVAEVKLLPRTEDTRYEVRAAGPNVFAGYLNDAAATAQAFDDEGFFVTGDAMTLRDPDDPNQGLRFEGRISEAFKLLSGTWVRTPSLRLAVMQALSGIAADVVITGADRADIGVFLIPTAEARTAPDAEDFSGALRIPSLTATLLAALGGEGGSSTRVARAMFLTDPLSMGAGEVTAKGSVNVHTLLTRRAALLDRLYNDADPATIILQREGQG